jgi:hypothetical protein
MGLYLSLEGKNGVVDTGSQFYWGAKKWPIARISETQNQTYNASSELKSLYKDAYNQVFFSLGTCVGVFYAYGSYRPVGARVILPAFVIAFLDFIFSICAGFVVWAGLAILNQKGDSSKQQTSSTGLTFIAFPRLADVSDSMGAFTIFMIFLWVSGIDSAISYMQGWIANNTDKDPASRKVYPLIVFGQCGVGYSITMLFCTNWGYILFDLIDHYISDYVILLVGILQCVAVGWVFEYESTAIRSEGHREALRSLAGWFWIPILACSFYANFAFASVKWVAVIVGILCLCCACFCSGMWFRRTELGMRVWYTEILLCGVNKISMSVSTTAEDVENRGMCAKFFEFYFGVAIKFLNPAILTFLLMENLSADLAAPYSEQPQNMTVFGTIFVFFMACMMCAPMLLCSDIEEDQSWLDHMTADDIAGGAMAGTGNEGDNYASKTIELPSKVVDEP